MFMYCQLTWHVGALSWTWCPQPAREHQAICSGVLLDCTTMRLCRSHRQTMPLETPLATCGSQKPGRSGSCKRVLSADSEVW